MNSSPKKNTILYLFAICGILSISSCGSTKETVYFSNLDTAKVTQVPISKFQKPLIQTDDILNITVQTRDIEAPMGLGEAGIPGGTSLKESGSLPAINGYLVNEEGNVELPMLGVIKVAGLTTSEATKEIRDRAAKYYKEPTVQVRFANYKITILGEVAKPAAYTVPNEKVTVLDAISMAGDLTIYGKRKNVMLIRDNGDKKDIIRLDLTSSTLMSSPYFYLKQNDVLYVEPSKGKIAANTAGSTRFITVGLSVIALIFTAIRVF
jgi:polysaccharide export outer membrane protein